MVAKENKSSNAADVLQSRILMAHSHNEGPKRDWVISASWLGWISIPTNLARARSHLRTDAAPPLLLQTLLSDAEPGEREHNASAAGKDYGPGGRELQESQQNSLIFLELHLGGMGFESLSPLDAAKSA
jgi:hypothetical protein